VSRSVSVSVSASASALTGTIADSGTWKRIIPGTGTGSRTTCRMLPSNLPLVNSSIVRRAAY
jgi:hypothetical protein